VCHQRAGDSATLQPVAIGLAKGGEDWWRTTVRSLLTPVWAAKLDAVRHEKNGGRMVPDRLKPYRFATSVKQYGAASMLSETFNPLPDFVPIERRI
jgi:hypothetical protein